MCGVGFEEEKDVQTEAIELLDGKCVREVNLDDYKYLELLQLDSIINREVKLKVKSKEQKRCFSHN